MAKIVILYKLLTDNEYEIMTEKEKMLGGEWYDAASDSELLSELYACRDKIYELNRLHPHVFIGPGCSLLTAVHPLDAQERNKGTEKALPVTIGDNVWLGGNVTVLPGVTIGEGAVVGAGSVVTRDVPPRTVVAGNPAHIIRSL